MNRIKKSMVAAGLTAGLLGGGAAGAILGTAGVSGAQETTTVEEDGTTTDSTADATAGDERPDPSTRHAETLAPLVSDGTITQAQADAVIAALAEAGPPEGGRGGPGGGGHHGRGGAGLAAAATAVGVTEDELRTALGEGQTIAEVAAEKGVDVQTVIDAMVAELQAHLAEEVTAGELTQEEADEKLADATSRITERVNSGGPERGAGRPTEHGADAEGTTGD